MSTQNIKINRIDTDRNPDHPEYEQTVTVWLDGAAYPAVRYVEDTGGRYLEQIIDEDGVYDDMTSQFDCPFDEYVLEAISVLSNAIEEGRTEGWTMEMLTGERGPSATNVEYE